MSERTEQQCDGPEEVKMSIGDCELMSVWRLTAEAIKHRIEHEGGEMSKREEEQDRLREQVDAYRQEIDRLRIELERRQVALAQTRGAYNNLKEMYKQIASEKEEHR